MSDDHLHILRFSNIFFKAQKKNFVLSCPFNEAQQLTTPHGKVIILSLKLRKQRFNYWTIPLVHDSIMVV